MQLSAVLLTIGLPAIDESLDKLLVAMETFPNVAVLGDAVGLARIIGLLLALCVGSYECWMMMLGRRGMDVMKLLRIVGISICISSSSWICDALQVPGKGLESASKAMAQAKNKEVAAFELKVAQKQSEYLDRLRTVQDSIATAQQVAAIGQDAAWWDKLIYNVENLGNTINNYAQRAVVATETKVSEWINDVIRFVGELIFQMSYYGILVAQRIFMAIMMIFCPIMFALSLAPPWNSAWIQWMSKFLSLSLWGFVTLTSSCFTTSSKTSWPTTTCCTVRSTHGRRSAHWGCRASAPTACTPWGCWSARTSSVSFRKWPRGSSPAA